MAPERPNVIRFGLFEADLAGRALRKSGMRVRLQQKPFRVLAMLLDRPGEVVTREELKQELWPNEEYGEFDLGLNTAVKKVRAALGDSGDSPKWIETVPKLGYKFLGPIVEPDPIQLRPAAADSSAIHANRSRKILWAVIAGLGASLALLIVGWPGARDSEVIVASIPRPPGVDNVIDLALSPDGRRLALIGEQSGRTQLWVRDLDLTSPRVIAGTGEAQYPFWSPDSRSIGFFVGDELRRVDVDGGEPLPIASLREPRGGSWNNNDVILVGHRLGGISRVSAAGGEPVAVTSPTSTPGLGTHRWPIFLPDGRSFLFHAGQGGALFDDGTTLYRGSLDSDDLIAVMQPSPGSVVYSAHRLLSVRDGVLFAQRFDPQSAKLAGIPEVVAERAGVRFAFSKALFSASETGLLALIPRAPDGLRELVRYNRAGERLGTLEEPGTPLAPQFSPDGNRLLYVETQNRGQIRVIDLDRGVVTTLTPPGRDERLPFWSADGASVYFTRFTESGPVLEERRADGSGGSKELLRAAAPASSLVTSVSPDGRLAVIQTPSGGDGQCNLWVASLGSEDGNATSRKYLSTDLCEAGGRISPDGRMATFRLGPALSPELHAAAFPTPAGRVRISPGLGGSSQWSADGTQVYYLDEDAFICAARIEMEGGDTPRVLSNERLFQIRGSFAMGPPDPPRFTVSPDGNEFVVVESAGGEDDREVQLVFNWPQRLER